LRALQFAAPIRRPFMPDYFAILQQPRRPWLDSEALKERFHRQTAEHHPDVSVGAAQGHFEDLNAAYSVLREPASRLRHLLELEEPERLALPQQIPPALADLFMRIAGFRRALDVFRQKEAAGSSALAKALMADERLELLQQGEAVRAGLENVWEAALADLAALDSDWQMDDRASGIIERLTTLHHQFAYLSKWRSQVAEALFQFRN
jgi:curved DNA-binding protein CbpA